MCRTIFVMLLTLLSAPVCAQERLFTSKEGVQLRAEIVSVHPEMSKMTILKDGVSYTIEPKMLILDDQQYIRDWLKRQGILVPLPRALSSAPMPPTTQKPPGPVTTNGLGMKFVPLPGAGISICIHETRRQDYAAFTTAWADINNSWQNPERDGVKAGTADDHPVVNVSAYDAEAFCRWLSQKEKRVYRLPNWREWSIAAGVADLEKPGTTFEEMRLAVKGRYFWGTEWPPAPGMAGNIADATLLPLKPEARIMDHYDDGHATTAPVMSFPPNNLGIYDLAGNVTEWVSDFVTKHSQRKLRGSSWSTGPRNSEHHASSPGDGGQPLHLRWNNIGFRCVLEDTPIPEGNLGKAVPMSGEVMVFGGHRYQVAAESCSWNEAMEKAKALGGHLAAITSEEEARFVADIVRPHLLVAWSSCWLGGRRTGDGQWEWITGEDFAYTDWMKGEPNARSANAVIVAWLPDGKSNTVNWNDTYDTGKADPNCRGFVVEWDDPGPAL
jgi:hypothetical protein